MINVGQETKLKQAQVNIKTLAAVAKQYSSEITLVYNAILSSDVSNNFQGESSDARFERLCGNTALGNSSIGASFRTFVMGNFTSETRLSFPMTAQGIQNAPAATRDAFNGFCRRFFNSLVILLRFAG